MDPSLERGDLLPEMRSAVPGPHSLEWSRKLARFEAPGINTLYRGKPNILWQEALGSNVLDVDGNRYIDLTAGFGVASIGHRHPAVVAAINTQGRHLLHALGDVIGHPARAELAARLSELAPMDDAQVYFSISGADAVEIAVKTALLQPAARRAGRATVLAFEPSYHGLTHGALALTSRPAFRNPFEAHLHPNLARLPYGCDIEHLETYFAGRQSSRAATPDGGPPCAVVVEPIVGREGVIVPPAGWLRHLSQLCRQYEALLITDEIFTGFGRTGYIFASQHEGFVPDLVCCGKALGGGLPIAAVLGNRETLSVWSTPGEALHTATFVAHPLACATALVTLQILESDDLLTSTRQRGEALGQELGGWPARFPHVLEEARGRGLFWGLALANADLASELVRRSWARGILMLAGGPQGRVAQLVPPLTISEDQLSHAVTILASILSELDAEAPTPAPSTTTADGQTP